MKMIIYLIFFTVLININIHADSKNVDPQFLQNELLKQQNEILKQTNADIRNSYYWALGFTGTFLVLFLGINTFLIRNKVKEDKEYLNNYIESTIIKEMNLIKEHNSQITNDIKELNNKELIKIHESLKFKIAESLTPVHGNIAGLRDKSFLLEIYILENEILINQLNKNYYSMLFNNKEVIKILLENQISSFYWKIGNCLERIEEILKTGYEVDTSLLSDYTEVLNKLPAEYTDAAHRVRILMM